MGGFFVVANIALRNGTRYGELKESRVAGRSVSVPVTSSDREGSKLFQGISVITRRLCKLERPNLPW